MDERRLLALETKLRSAVIPDPGRLRQMLAELWQVNAPACSVEFDFHVTDSTTHADVSGATVQVTNGAGATVATLTTDSGGLAAAVLTGIDSYSATVSATLYVTQTVLLSAPACGGVTAVSVALVEQTCTYTFTVKGCNALPIGVALQGATIAVTGLTPVTTNSSGQASVTLTTTGSKSYTVSAARMNDATGTIAGPPSCGTSAIAITLTNADVLTWICSVCPLPINQTLNVTSNAHGSATLTYQNGSGHWTGTADSDGTTYNWDGNVSGNTTVILVNGVVFGVSGSTLCPAADGTGHFEMNFGHGTETVNLTE